MRREQNRVANEQRASVERLSKSPPKNQSRTKLNSTERIETLHTSIKKPKHSLVSDFAVADLETPQRNANEGRQNFFSTRHKSQAVQLDPVTAKNSSLINRKNFEMSRAFNNTMQPKGPAMHARKLSVQDEIMRRANEERLLMGSSDSKQKPAAMQKKLSVAPKLRAHSTL